MDKQYFIVGEEVILASKDRPDLNGEYVITMMPNRGDIILDESGHEWRVATDAGIFLEGLEGARGPIPWCQSALRKKHQGGDDFQSLIHKMNNDKAEEI